MFSQRERFLCGLNDRVHCFFVSFRWHGILQIDVYLVRETNDEKRTWTCSKVNSVERDLFDELNGIERFLTIEQIDSITLFTQIDQMKTISCTTTPLDQPLFNHLRFSPFISAQYWTNVIFPPPPPATANKDKDNSSRMERFVAFLWPVSPSSAADSFFCTYRAPCMSWRNMIDSDEIDSSRNEEVRHLMRFNRVDRTFPESF